MIWKISKVRFLHFKSFHVLQIRLHVQGYEDYLQSPLQPLMDNLESGTYEVFEKDPVIINILNLLSNLSINSSQVNRKT